MSVTRYVIQSLLCLSTLVSSSSSQLSLQHCLDLIENTKKQLIRSEVKITDSMSCCSSEVFNLARRETTCSDTRVIWCSKDNELTSVPWSVSPVSRSVFTVQTLLSMWSQVMCLYITLTKLFYIFTKNAGFTDRKLRRKSNFILFCYVNRYLLTKQSFVLSFTML